LRRVLVFCYALPQAKRPRVRDVNSETIVGRSKNMLKPTSTSALLILGVSSLSAVLQLLALNSVK
jgi:hypothetical protein